MASNKLDQIATVLEGLKEDRVKFYEKGNGAAGRRIRQAMLEIRGLATDIRKEVSDLKQSSK